jgi:carboxymethylenebutenolidase
MITQTLILGAAVVVAASLGLARAEAPAGVPLPAGQDTAEAALTASPRHGEWVDIPMEGGAALKTWVVYPERADKAPVVLVIHEIFGLTDWVRAVADQLAAEGFIAVAPDFLSGMGPDGGGTSSMDVGVVREKIRTLTPADVALRLDAAKQWAIAQPGATERFGCIGFCWGGSQSFNYATAQAALGAAVVYYGTAPTDAAAIGRIGCPVLGLYGGDDARVTSTVEATEEAMHAAGKRYTPHVYAGAGHGFLRQRAGRDANADAAARAWGETVAFLREALGE